MAMQTAWRLLVVAVLALSGCAAMGGEEGDDLLLQVRFSGTAIAAVEVVDRAEPGRLAEHLRPQQSGDIGIIWTDYSSGETLAGGWMPPMEAGGEQALHLVVPAPGAGGALLTITQPTEHGPVVATVYLDL
jgi:hypothetical protein